MATARSRPSTNADIIRIPTSLSTPSEPPWKPPSPSPTSHPAFNTSQQASLVKDVKEALSTFQSGSAQKAEATQNIPRLQSPPIQSQQDNDLHSKFALVLGSRTKKKIYPLAPVLSECWNTAEYMERFEYVQTELRRAIDRHRELRDHARSIDFLLRMVGTSSQAAEPSIVIVCRVTEYKKLRALFREKAGEKLYCGKRSRVFEMFKKYPPARQPPFKLVYYRTDSETFRRKAASHIATMDIPVDGVLPGKPVYYQRAQAKIGVTFNVDNMTLSTTVDHLFNPQSGQFSRTPDDDAMSITSFESDQRTLDDSDLISLDPLWADDSEDDDPEDDDTPPAVVSAPQHTDSKTSVSSCAIAEHAYGRKVEPTAQVSGSEPHLDYALLEFSPPVLQTLQPNTCRLNEADEVGFPLQSVAVEPRYHAVPVYLLSGARGVQTGRLLSTYAYLGSNPGQEPCKVWTLILDGENGLADGDCGSIVIDQETHAVYGHVIGSNPMDQVYVVPLKHIVEQMKVTFETSKVSLYDPTRTSQAARTTFLADTFNLNNEPRALVPYRCSDLCLPSQTKALHRSGRSGWQEGQDTGEGCRRQYAKSYEPFACICGRGYDHIPASPLNLEELFRNATRPTSRAEVLTFWLSMLEFIRPKKSVHYLREAMPKECTIQKTLVCHRSAQSVDGIRSELMRFHGTDPDKSKSQSTAEWNNGVSKDAPTSNQLARVFSATSPEHDIFPCRYCQVRQGAYYLFSIGGLLLESLVWVLAGHDSLNDLQQRRRNSDVSLVDQSLQLFNKESFSLHAKAIANGDSASLEVLQLTERILNQDLDFPELWRWQQKILEELERRLNMMRKKEPNFLGKRTSNKRALDSFIIQNFARNPVVDPNGPDPKSPSEFRALVSRVGHNLLRAFSRKPMPPDSSFRKNSNTVPSSASAIQDDRLFHL